MDQQRYSCRQTTITEPVLAEVIELVDNDAGLVASIAPGYGGELSSLRYRHEGNWLELLYRGNDFTPIDTWQGRAPLLWPAVGRSFTEEQIAEAHQTGEEPSMGRYRFGENEYDIACHGFAMKKDWSVLSHDSDDESASASCILEDDVKSRAVYPFEFRLEVRYALVDDKIKISYEVNAASDNESDMPFTIGNHISVNFPFVASGSWNEGILQGPATLEYGISDVSLFDGSTSPKDFRPGIQLTDPKVCNMVSGGFDGESYLKLVQPGAFNIRVSQEVDSKWQLDDHCYFVLWGDPEQRFICPEPWLGGPNSLNTGEGLVRLPPGESFTWTMTIEIIPG